MPLVMLCGQPCSGKSGVAAQLAAAFRALGLPVDVVDEPGLHASRNASYDTVVHEKNTRAKLKSQVESLLSRKSVTIMDTLNNIKGYRYELWCITRALGTRYCMVHVDTGVATCRAWNEARQPDDAYSPVIFDDLASRFERPDARNRWDAPLFTVCPEAGPEAVLAVVEDIVRAMTMTQEAGSGGPGMQAVKVLQPTMATSNPTMLATNTLHDIDQAAQDIVNAVVEAQAAAAGGPAGLVSFGDNGIMPLQLREVVTMAELRRLKREFLKLATKITFARLQDAPTARRMFVDYLRSNLLQT